MRYRIRRQPHGSRGLRPQLSPGVTAVQERAATAHDAIAAITAAVDQRLVEMQEFEHPAPPPLSERKYNGTFVVRTSRELHARLAREAIEQRVSMNQWVVQKLSGRELPSGLGLFGLD
jgi:predicted HicB family RNase H-like nuclease